MNPNTQSDSISDASQSEGSASSTLSTNRKKSVSSNSSKDLRKSFEDRVFKPPTPYSLTTSNAPYSPRTSWNNASSKSSSVATHIAPGIGFTTNISSPSVGNTGILPPPDLNSLLESLHSLGIGYDASSPTSSIGYTSPIPRSSELDDDQWSSSVSHASSTAGAPEDARELLDRLPTILDLVTQYIRFFPDSYGHIWRLCRPLLTSMEYVLCRYHFQIYLILVPQFALLSKSL
jgi:hypothetical protein